MDSEESLFSLEFLAAAVSQKAFSEHELNVEFICLEFCMICILLEEGVKIIHNFVLSDLARFLSAMRTASYLVCDISRSMSALRLSSSEAGAILEASRNSG